MVQPLWCKTPRRTLAEMPDLIVYGESCGFDATGQRKFYRSLQGGRLLPASGSTMAQCADTVMPKV